MKPLMAVGPPAQPRIVETGTRRGGKKPDVHGGPSAEDTLHALDNMQPYLPDPQRVRSFHYPEQPASDWSPSKGRQLFSLHGTPFGSKGIETGRTSKTAAPPPSKKKAKNAKISPEGVQPLTAAEQSDAVARKVLGESSAFLGILPANGRRLPRPQRVSAELSQNRPFVGPPRLCLAPCEVT